MTHTYNVQGLFEIHLFHFTLRTHKVSLLKGGSSMSYPWPDSMVIVARTWAQYYSKSSSYNGISNPHKNPANYVS